VLGPNAPLCVCCKQGIVAEKISGMYKPGADLRVPLLAVDRAVEVKCCAAGFRQLYDWLDQCDVLIIKADRREPLVVVRLSLAAEIARGLRDASPSRSDHPSRSRPHHPRGEAGWRLRGGGQDR
jgi:hypothetical protein